MQATIRKGELYAAQSNSSSNLAATAIPAIPAIQAAKHIAATVTQQHAIFQQQSPHAIAPDIVAHALILKLV